MFELHRLKNKCDWPQKPLNANDSLKKWPIIFGDSKKRITRNSRLTPGTGKRHHRSEDRL